MFAMRKLNGHLSIVKLLGRKFKIINLATLEASMRSKKQNLKIFNMITQRKPDAMQKWTCADRCK